jgi:hypothetical protein
VPKQAVIARDSQALSPSRSALAQLLHQRARHAAQAEPPNARLVRLDGAVAGLARAKARLEEQRVAHLAAAAEAIAAGEERPGKPAALAEAEEAATAAEFDHEAAEAARAAIVDEVAGMNDQLSRLGREVSDQSAWVLAESAVSFARERYPPAFRALREAEAVVDGVYRLLRQSGQREMAQGSGGTAELQALEWLERQLRELREALLADKSTNLQPALDLQLRLASDPAAELEA